MHFWSLSSMLFCMFKSTLHIVLEILSSLLSISDRFSFWDPTIRTFQTFQSLHRSLTSSSSFGLDDSKWVRLLRWLQEIFHTRCWLLGKGPLNSSSNLFGIEFLHFLARVKLFCLANWWPICNLLYRSNSLKCLSEVQSFYCCFRTPFYKIPLICRNLLYSNRTAQFDSIFKDFGQESSTFTTTPKTCYNLLWNSKPNLV